MILRRAELRHASRLALAVSFALLGGAAWADGSSPRAVVSPLERDLGRIAPGAPAAADFEIRNEGSAPLELGLQPDPLPPVVQGSDLDRRIAPGASGHLRLHLDSTRLMGPTSLVFRLTTSDPQAAEIPLTVKLDVRPFVLARPGSARFITVIGEVEGTISQTLWADDGRDFRVLEVTSPDPALEVRFHEAQEAERRPDQPGRQWRVDATLTSRAKVGALTGNLVVRVDHPGQSEVRIPLSGFVRPTFAVTPPAAEIGTFAPRPGASWKLLVKNFGTQPATITSATSDVAGLQLEVVPVEAGRTYHVRLRLADGFPTGAFAGTLEMHTTSQATPVIRVPVSGTIVAPPSLAAGPSPTSGARTAPPPSPSASVSPGRH